MILGRSQNGSDSSTSELISKLLSSSESNDKVRAEPILSCPCTISDGGEFEETEEASFGNVDAEDQATNAEDPFMQFNLFGDAEMSSVTLEATTPTSSHQSRPLSFYLWKPSQSDREKFVNCAISGTRVLQEAQASQSLALRKPVAPDVNHSWVPPRRRCRPGKSARASKRSKHERLKQEEKDRQERIRNQRRFRKRPDSVQFR